MCVCVYIYIYIYIHKHYSHANTRKQSLYEKKNQIPTWNKLQDIVKCNRQIHLVKSYSESDEHIRAPNRTSRIKNCTWKHVRGNRTDINYIACDTQPWTWPPTRRHECTCDKNNLRNLEYNQVRKIGVNQVHMHATPVLRPFDNSFWLTRNIGLYIN